MHFKHNEIKFYLLGADIENIVNTAALKAAKEDCDSVTNAHLEWARDKRLMGKLPFLTWLCMTHSGLILVFISVILITWLTDFEALKVKPRPWGTKGENVSFLPSISPAVKSFTHFTDDYIAQLLINRSIPVHERILSTHFLVLGFNVFIFVFTSFLCCCASA